MLSYFCAILVFIFISNSYFIWYTLGRLTHFVLLTRIFFVAYFCLSAFHPRHPARDAQAVPPY
ncbi:hypothetical protein BJ165DRAFT_1493510 [Panaeolus papilionaceus]|nr:hypothetical protein BJ165DRAFT_1493510 [Panaeolus papilionaceus]